MRKCIRLQILLVLCISFGLILNGCNGGDSDSESIFITSLSIQDTNGQEKSTFAQGEQIQFEVSILNTTNSTQTLTFSSSQQYDFIARQSGTSNIIWRWSHNRGFLTVITTLTFAPGETKTFSELWDQTDNNGVLVGPGSYEAQGSVEGGPGSDGAIPNDTTPSQFRSSFLTFEII